MRRVRRRRRRGELRRPGVPAAGVSRSRRRRAPRSGCRRRRATCGGQTATALATCASLGLRATYLGAVGDDDDGRRIRRELAARGIDVAHREVERGADAPRATILLDATGDRLVLWHRDPALRYPPDRLPADVIAASRVAARRRRGRAGGHRGGHGSRAPTASRSRATSTTSRRRTRELLQLVSHPVFAEQRAARADRGDATPERALRALRRTHPGPAGRDARRAGRHRARGRHAAGALPASRRSVVDTTGAGDVFRGGVHLRPRRRAGRSAPAPVRERGGGRQLHEGRRDGRRARRSPRSRPCWPERRPAGRHAPDGCPGRPRPARPFHGSNTPVPVHGVTSSGPRPRLQRRIRRTHEHRCSTRAASRRASRRADAGRRRAARRGRPRRARSRSDAGRGAGFADVEYEKAGGRIVYSGEEVYGRADLVLKVLEADRGRGGVAEGRLDPDGLPAPRRGPPRPHRRDAGQAA